LIAGSNFTYLIAGTLLRLPYSCQGVSLLDSGNLLRLSIKSSASGELAHFLDGRELTGAALPIKPPDSGESVHLLDGGELADGTGGEVAGQDVEPRGDAVGQAVLTLHAGDYSTVVS
jgi:hypothetical protein